MVEVMTGGTTSVGAQFQASLTGKSKVLVKEKEGVTHTRAHTHVPYPTLPYPQIVLYHVFQLVLLPV